MKYYLFGGYDIYEVINPEETIEILKKFTKEEKHAIMHDMRLSIALHQLHIKGLIKINRNNKIIDKEIILNELIGLENMYDELLSHGFAKVEIELSINGPIDDLWNNEYDKKWDELNE